MLERTALCRLLALATLLVASLTLGWPASQSQAQETGAQPRYGASASPSTAPRDPVIGGYSTTLSEIWGPPEMPPAPKDFGPHFDFPPQPLMDNGGGLLHDPYMH
ncbi:MAG: hypothetical protein ACLQF1_03705 [Methyloceanibacter sp.]|jgi:hypothetical protein